MKAITSVLAGGVAIAALASAAPAAAQYYPGYGYGGGVGQVLAQVLGGPGYGGYGYNSYGPGVNSQAAINQCVGAVQQRLNGGYGPAYPSYGYNGYGAPGGYGNARVLGISRVEPRSDGGVVVRGVANSGRYAGYGYNGYGYNGGQPPVDLTFRCKADYRGFVYDVDINQAERNYNYGYTPYSSPYSNDYSQYGYRRY